MPPPLIKPRLSPEPSNLPQLLLLCLNGKAEHCREWSLLCDHPGETGQELPLRVQSSSKEPSAAFLSHFLLQWDTVMSPEQPMGTEPRAQQGAVGAVLLRLWLLSGMGLVTNKLLPNTSMLHMAGISLPQDPPREQQVLAAFPLSLGMAVTKGNCPGLGVVLGVGP